MFPNRAPMERAACLQDLFYISVKGPRKGASLHFPQQWGPYGNRCPFPEPYLIGSTCTYLPNYMMLCPQQTVIAILTPDICQCCNITASVMEKL